MATQQRPLSPHLQVYRPQITSVMSIAHRITGVINAFGALLLAAALIAIASGEAGFDKVAHVMASLHGKLVLAVFCFTLTYHLLNGIRHLIWDAGHGYQIPSVYRSGYIVIMLSVLITALLWWVALAGGAP